MAVGVGVICVMAGIGWALLSCFVAQAAVRGVAGWASIGGPGWSFAPAALGIVAIVWS